MATKKKMLITQAEYSRRRGCSKPYISKLVSQGIITLTDGMVDPEAADSQIADYSAQMHPKEGEDSHSLAEWRRRELKVKCALKQLELDEEKNKMINAEELKTEFAKLFVDIKTTLRGIPSKAAGELYHMAKNAKSDREGMAAIATLLLREIDEALTALSQWQPKSNKKGGGKGKKIGPTRGGRGMEPGIN